MALRIQPCAGAQIARHLPAIARLRIQVFREFPYLYQGTLAYEETYLQRYAEDDQHLAVLALDDDVVVGVSTAMPLTKHLDDVVPPFAAAGFDPAAVFYFGESVLLDAFRGRGIGHAFFDEREAFGRRLGFAMAAFCAVERPADHPLRPPGYQSLDAFWVKRGYQKQSELRTTFAWQDIDQPAATAKPMVFWTKAL